MGDLARNFWPSGGYPFGAHPISCRFFSTARRGINERVNAITRRERQVKAGSRISKAVAMMGM